MRSWILIVIIASLMVISSLFAKEMQGKLSPINAQQKIYYVGDIFSAKLIVWPADENDFKNIDIDNKELFEGLYIVKLENIKRSENNYDLFEIDLTLAITKPLKQSSFYVWEYKNFLIPITLTNIEVRPNNTQENEFIVLDQNVPKYYTKLYVIASALTLMLIVLVYFLYKRYRERQKLKEERQRQEIMLKHWTDKFINAKERVDYEQIYQAKDQWQEYIPITQDVLLFFEELNKHQYKKMWFEKEYQMIEKTFSIIRESVREL